MLLSYYRIFHLNFPYFSLAYKPPFILSVWPFFTVSLREHYLPHLSFLLLKNSLPSNQIVSFLIKSKGDKRHQLIQS